MRDLDANDTQFEGLVQDPQAPPHNIDFYQTITDDYLVTMNIDGLSGRGFARADGGDAAPVALVNRKTAETFWPGLDPIGRRLRPDDDNLPWITVVGIVDVVKQGGIDQETGTEVYFRYAQVGEAFGPFLPRTMYTLVRSTLPEAAIAQAIRDQVRASWRSCSRSSPARRSSSPRSASTASSPTRWRSAARSSAFAWRSAPTAAASCASSCRRGCCSRSPASRSASRPRWRCRGSSSRCSSATRPPARRPMARWRRCSAWWRWRRVRCRQPARARVDPLTVLRSE